MDHHEVLQLNKVFELVYEKWFVLLRSKARRMNRGSNIDDDILTFLGKYCGMTSAEVHELFLGEQATYGRVMKWFYNHLIDRIRKENGKKKIKAAPIHENTHLINQAKSYSLEFEVNETKNRFKKIVAERFPKEEYQVTFGFILEGYSNEDIVKETGYSNSKVGSIRHRIKKHLLEIDIAC